MAGNRLDLDFCLLYKVVDRMYSPAYSGICKKTLALFLVGPMVAAFAWLGSLQEIQAKQPKDKPYNVPDGVLR
jgi:hypothetical protein